MDNLLKEAIDGIIELGYDFKPPVLSYEELKILEECGGVKFLKTSYYRGYVSRTRKDFTVIPYTGKYGVGYKVLRPNWNSTTYSFVDYYIF